MKYKFFVLVSLLCLNAVVAQEKYYEFPISDGSRMMTMRQSNELVQNANRLLGEILVTNPKSEMRYFTWSTILTGALLLPITHEEGHRAVLTENNIGSVSQPIFDKNFVAKVTGVSNQTLIELRNNDLPTYIRLHTAGLESDFCYLNSLSAKLAFEEEESKYVYADMIIRYAGVLGYYLSSFIVRKINIEEANVPELDLDIVGHDIWGMVRHLHRPDDPDFHRYTTFSELTSAEKKYARRMAWFSLANLINPNLYGFNNFTLKNGNKIGFNVGYSLAPFGDFFRQTIYYLVPEKDLKMSFYLSEYFNKNRFFWGSGLQLHNYKLSDKWLVNSLLDVWSQPKNLSFTTRESNFGAGFSFSGAYKFFQNEKHSLFLNVGFSAKTKGFLPENMALDGNFRMRTGIIYALKK